PSSKMRLLFLSILLIAFSTHAFTINIENNKTETVAADTLKDAVQYKRLLRSHHGTYLRANPLGTVDLDSFPAGEYERWYMYMEEVQGKLTLKTAATNFFLTFLRADWWTNLINLSRYPEEWEMWTKFANDNGSFSFQSAPTCPIKLTVMNYDTIAYWEQLN
ncbi:hypothetical protein PMAYCL1PPCAC_07914, partial [Pristionchus mayeri]